MKKIITLLMAVCLLFSACAPAQNPADDPAVTPGDTTNESAQGDDPAQTPQNDATKEEQDPVELTKKEQIAQDMANAMRTTPELYDMADFDPTGSFAGIKAYWFEGMEMNGQMTKVFAYVGFPKGASADDQVPAIVLLHGGGGHAFLQWVLHA